jgi:uncharacterized membrane protein YoaK (UPF0700 family)
LKTNAATPLPSTRFILIALLLAVVGGGVDAVLVLSYGVLTAAQTGNTIFLAVAVSERHVANAVLSATSLVGFVVGVGIGEVMMIARDLSASTARRIGLALAVELITLAILVVVWKFAGAAEASSRTSFFVVAFAAIAMGIQTAAGLRLNVGPVTTYVTGTLTTLTIDVIHPPASGAQPPRPGLLSGKRPLIYAISWIFYFAGALLTGAIDIALSRIALLLPMVAIMVAIVIALSGNGEQGTGNGERG